MDIFKELVDLLIEKNMTIASAESCTGGLFAASIVDVPDASKVLDSSIVTYSNYAKQKFVQVEKETIDKFGAVSEQVAAEMAEGVSIVTGSSVGVSFSGIAGPTGGTKDKPVGTVCVGCYMKGRVWTHTFHFDEKLSRREIREQSVKRMAETLLEILR